METPLLSFITTRLAATSDTPSLDASVLLARIVDKPRSWVLAHPESTLTSEQQNQLDKALARLENGESLPYVLGKWEFFDLEFEVTPDVLIPRPETELLVEKAIAWIRRHHETHPSSSASASSAQRFRIADVGTGSGAIAISLAVNLPHINIIATDISPKAIQVAKRNAETHGVQNKIEFIECDFLPTSSLRHGSGQAFTLHHSSFDLICANLPYIPTSTLHSLPIFQKEPSLALDGGDTGFRLIEKLMQLAPQRIAPNAVMLLEIEATLGAQAIELAHRYFPQARIRLHQDLASRDRLLEIQT